MIVTEAVTIIEGRLGQIVDQELPEPVFFVSAEEHPFRYIPLAKSSNGPLYDTYCLGPDQFKITAGISCLLPIATRVMAWASAEFRSQDIYQFEKEKLDAHHAWDIYSWKTIELISACALAHPLHPEFIESIADEGPQGNRIIRTVQYLGVLTTLEVQKKETGLFVSSFAASKALKLHEVYGPTASKFVLNQMRSDTNPRQILQYLCD
jgi:hypothetical protein